MASNCDNQFNFNSNQLQHKEYTKKRVKGTFQSDTPLKDQI